MVLRSLDDPAPIWNDCSQEGFALANVNGAHPKVRALLLGSQRGIGDACRQTVNKHFSLAEM